MEEIRRYIPYFKIKLVKAQEEPPKDYTLQEVELLLKKPEYKAKFTEWRTWTIASFIIGTGARIGTIIEIRMSDVNLKDGKVYYRHTKSKKLQVANMPPQLIKALKSYIDLWRQGATDDDYLFCTVSNEALSRHSAFIAYGKYANERGVKKTSMHGLRHTFAREWYLNGGDVVQLSKILGHTSIKMSEKYMNIYADTAQDKFNLFNPLENINKSRGKATKTVKRSE
jgi:integrase/recombinase XerD